MTYEEFKDKVAREVSQKATNCIWFDTEKEIKKM